MLEANNKRRNTRTTGRYRFALNDTGALAASALPVHPIWLAGNRVTFGRRPVGLTMPSRFDAVTK